MKKYIYPAATLIALVVVYVLVTNLQTAHAPDTAAEDTLVQLIARSADELDSFTVFVPGWDFAFERGEDGLWFELEHPGLPLNQQMAEDMAATAFALTAVPLLDDGRPVLPDDPAEFGIGDISVAASFTDGTSAVFYIGAITPDRQYAYLMRRDDAMLYLVPAHVRERFLWDLGELVEIFLPIINPRTLEFLYIREHGREPLQFSWHSTEAEKQEMLDTVGALVLHMDTPFHGRMLFYEALELELGPEFHEMQLGAAINLAPTANHLQELGLAEPSLVIIKRDSESELALRIGGRHDADTFYAQIGGTDTTGGTGPTGEGGLVDGTDPVGGYVFLLENRYIDGFFGLNPFLFVERFLAIPNIVDVADIRIFGEDFDYQMSLTHFMDEERPRLTAAINGQEVDEAAFREFFVRLVALQFEQEILEGAELEVPYTYTIIYSLLDGTEIELQLFPFDVNFYAVREWDRWFAVSRLGVDAVMDWLHNEIA